MPNKYVQTKQYLGPFQQHSVRQQSYPSCLIILQGVEGSASHTQGRPFLSMVETAITINIFPS
jgi:hypothetical protein